MQDIAFAGLVARARRIAGMTAAQFDYSLRSDTDSTARNAWDMALSSEAGDDRAAYEALRVTHQAAFLAMVEAAKTKQYTGWSTASRGPIQYAQ